MTRKFFFFSEMGYNAYPIEALEQYGYSALLFPNSILEALLQIISANGFTSGARRIDVANPLGESEKPITTWLYLP